MSSIGQLWRRAPLWRADLIAALTFSALAVIYPARFAAPTSLPPAPLADAPAGAVLPCSEEHGVASVVGPQLPVQYENGTPEPVSVYWLDQSGQRKFYEAVDAGRSKVQPGSATSYWVVADARQHCIGIVHPGRDTGAILVHDSANGPDLVVLH